jgi:putative SOS response-associated peptidase YedK
MCGRCTMRSSPQAVAEAFALPDVPELFLRFNIAPGQRVAVVQQEPRAEGRELAVRPRRRQTTEPSGGHW